MKELDPGGDGPRHQGAAADEAASPTATVHRSAPWPRARSARPRTTSVFLDRARAGGRRRGRGHLGPRGGPAHPPRRAPGRAGVRPAADPRRHRRRLDRGARRRARRDPRGAQLQARRRPAHRPLLPGRRGHREAGRRHAARTSARSSPVSSERSHEHGFDVAIASSGTAETVAQMVHAPTRGRRAAHLQLLRVHAASELGRRRRPRSSPSARATLRAGGPGSRGRAGRHHRGRRTRAAVRADAFGVERFTFSEDALREGVLLDTLARTSGGRPAAPPARRRPGAASHAARRSAATTT